MKLTKEKAKELSILKWKLIIKNDGKLPINLFDEYPELEKLRHYCGYCELYFKTHNKMLSSCVKCPINPNIKDYNDLEQSGCAQKIHPFHIWWVNSTKENAQAVLDLIEKS